jgi:hypothetical protein
MVLVTAGLLAIQTPVAQLIIAQGRLWTAFLMNLGWALTFLAVTYGLRDWGACGLATARALAYAVHATWTLGFAYLILSRSTDHDAE